MVDRDREWASLLRLLDDGPGARLGVVWGARRVGKSFLLAGLCEAVGGLYVQALRQDAVPFLTLLGRIVATRIGAPAPLRFDDWVGAIDALVDLPGVPLVVLDEFPYLVEAAPELPSIVQAAVDRRQGQTALVLCGSAISQMTSLLGADSPLYRRARLALPVTSFDAPTAAQYWGLSHRPGDAMLVDAVVGGVPGYRDVFGPVPDTRHGGVQRWVVERVLDPTRTTFDEDDLVLATDPSIRDANVYRSVLAAVVAGERTPTGIAGFTGRKVTSLTRPVERMVDAGLLTRTPDPLRERRSLLDVTDPFLRFHYGLIRPHRLALARGRASEVWADGAETFRSRVLGPRFEMLCRQALASGLGGPLVAEVGASVVYDVSGRATHEVDIVGCDDEGRVVLVGEVKASTVPRDPARDVARLETVRDLLPPARRADEITLAVCALGGFEPGADLAARPDVALIDPARLVAEPGATAPGSS